MPRSELRPLEWVTSSRKDLKTFPADVRDVVGYALYLAQIGGRHRDAKPLKGFSADTLEVVANRRGDTFRAVYTIRFAKAVYVLHAFQKKAKRGRATPKHDMKLIDERLKAAERHYEANYR
jgi:phage-related protein